MRNKRGMVAAGVALASAVLALSACTPAASSGSPTTGHTDKTLRIGINLPMPTWDIAGLQSGQIDTLYNSVFDTLLYTDPSNGITGPGAAKSWKYNSDNTVLTLQLRSGMTFTDGSPVDADAAVKSLQRIKAGTGSGATFLAHVKTVTAQSRLSIELDLDKPDPGLLGYLAQRGGVLESPAAFADPNIKLDPVGSGPYSLDKNQSTPGSKYTLVRNDKFRFAREFPYKEVVFTVFPTSTAALNALRSNQIDFSRLDLGTVDGAKGAGLTIQPMKHALFGGLFLADRGGTKLPALKSLQVRQAINYAIDRNSIAKNLDDGWAEPAEQLLAPTASGYVKGLDHRYDYNVNKAKQLMAEAGYAAGFAVDMPSYTNVQPYEATIEQELAAIKITVNWQPVPADQVNSRIGKGEWPMFMFFNGMETVQHDFNANVMPTGLLNPFHTFPAELSDYMAQAAQATSASERTSAYQKAETYLSTNAWFAPVVNQDDIDASGSKVKFTPPVGKYHIDMRSFVPAK